MNLEIFVARKVSANREISFDKLKISQLKHPEIGQVEVRRRRDGGSIEENFSALSLLYGMAKRKWKLYRHTVTKRKLAMQISSSILVQKSIFK